ncbi:hypothetical protein Tco_0438109 [Tanacetum coccineum]
MDGGEMMEIEMMMTVIHLGMEPRDMRMRTWRIEEERGGRRNATTIACHRLKQLCFPALTRAGRRAVPGWFRRWGADWEWIIFEAVGPVGGAVPSFLALQGSREGYTVVTLTVLYLSHELKLRDGKKRQRSSRLLWFVDLIIVRNAVDKVGERLYVEKGEKELYFRLNFYCRPCFCQYSLERRPVHAGRVVWRNKSDLDTMSIDDLYNNFNIVEQEVKRTVTSNSNSISSSQNMAFVSSPNSTNGVNTTNVQVSTVNSPVTTTK